jgi:hypothetical protein
MYNCIIQGRSSLLSRALPEAFVSATTQWTKVTGQTRSWDRVLALRTAADWLPSDLYPMKWLENFTKPVVVP